MLFCVPPVPSFLLKMSAMKTFLKTTLGLVPYIGGLVSSVVPLFPVEASFIREWSDRKLNGVSFSKKTEKSGSFAKIILP